MVEYRNNQRCGCLICVNEELSNFLNPLFLSAEMSVDDIVEILEDDHGIFLTSSELIRHKDHIVCAFDDKEKIEDRLEKISNLSNIDAINYEIARLEVLEEEMRADQKLDTPAMSNVIKSKQKYIEMKIKIMGEEVSNVNVNVLPSWISKIREPVLIDNKLIELEK